MGGTFYNAGLYYSNGVRWEFMETPWQAVQAEVDAGVNFTKFVTPLTFDNAAKWNTKQGVITLTTVGSSGPATLIGDVLNIPQYSGGGTGTTNLGYIASPTQGEVTSSTGTSAIITLAGATNAGLMSPADYTKLQTLAVITASNGLTKSGNDIQLGGGLNNATIITQASNKITFTGATSGNNELINIINTSTGQALRLDAGTNGVALRAVAAGNNITIQADSANGKVFTGIITGGATGGVQPIILLTRSANLNPVNGIGLSIDLASKVNNSTLPVVSQIKSITTDVTAASFASKIVLTAANAGVLNDVVEFVGTGAIKFNMYTGTTFDGTPTKSLGVDASGNVITFTPSAGGGIAEAPIDGQQYARQNAAWTVVTSSGGGQTETFTWKYNTVLGPTPGSGFFRLDAATAAASTHIYVANLTSNNQIDVSNLMEHLTGDWDIYIQQRNDATRWVQYNLNGDPVDGVDYWDIPVIYIQQGGGGPIASSADCLFTFINRNSGSGGGGLTMTQLTNVTIPAIASWTLVSGVYEYTHSDAAITATSIVDVIPENASMGAVRAADMLPKTTALAGGVKLYALYPPTTSIIVSMNILK
jgi:hypothetical protein